MDHCRFANLGNLEVLTSLFCVSTDVSMEFFETRVTMQEPDNVFKSDASHRPYIIQPRASSRLFQGFRSFISDSSIPLTSVICSVDCGNDMLLREAHVCDF